MRTYKAVVAIVACLPSLFAPARSSAQTAATGAFTYQGQILNSGQAYSGTADLEFALYDAVTGGAQVGATQTVSGVTVASGVFTVTLNGAGQFGTSPFSGNAGWLQVLVRTPSGSGSFVPLSPRVPLTAAPYAAGLVFPFLGSGTTASTPLMLVQNSGAGVAFSGESTSGHGVYGRNGAGSGIPTLDGYGTGVWGDTDNGNGVVGTSGTGFGVYGAYSKSSGLAPPAGTGVVGDSKSGLGVLGMSSTNTGVYGVRGSFSGITAPSASAGVIGDSHGFPGVIGLSSTNSAVEGISTSANGVYGRNGNGSGITPLFGFGSGAWGDTDNGLGVTGTSGSGYGVYGAAGSASGLSPGRSGVVGDCGSGAGVTGLSSTNNGVYGVSAAVSGLSPPFSIPGGVVGDCQSGPGVVGLSSTNNGVIGVSGAPTSLSAVAGVVGDSQSVAGLVGLSGTYNGVMGRAGGATGLSEPFQSGVWGDSNGAGTSNIGIGVLGTATAGYGVLGVAKGAGATAVSGVASGTGVQAGYFVGDVQVTGNMSKGGGSFKIDHPLDPANKYLYHSFVESPDMMDIYNGTATTDEKGFTTVIMPEWFQALNRDFRYQLTVVNETDTDEFVQAMVVKKMRDNRFTIKTSRGKTEVSWQVTGIRQDVYANAHRIPIEEYKSEQDRGLYLYPTEQGQPKERGIDWRRPGRIQERTPEACEKSATTPSPLQAISSRGLSSRAPSAP